MSSIEAATWGLVTVRSVYVLPMPATAGDNAGACGACLHQGATAAPARHHGKRSLPGVMPRRTKLSATLVPAAARLPADARRWRGMTPKGIV